MKYWLSIVLLFFVSCGGNTLSDERSWVDTAAQEKGVILALGDSLTAGYGLENSQSYPSKLQVLLDEG